MGLSVALTNALSGLNVNQQALTVLSQNIANANTVGYSRQSITQQSVYLDGQGQGVSISDISRKVDEYLTRAVQTQTSGLGKSSVIDDYNTRIQLMIGQPGSQNSIDSYINSFFNSVQSLAQTPQNTTLQQGTVNAAVNLADQFSRVSNGLRDLQYRADQDIVVSISAVNNSLKNIFDLNGTIIANAAAGKSVSELQDQRDNFLRDISQYMNINTFMRDNGAINISASNGLPLLDDSLYALDYTPTASPEAFTNGTQMFPIRIYSLDGNGIRREPPSQLVPGGIPSTIVNPLSGGKIAGLLDLRDTQLPDINNQLDQMAAQIRDEVNAIHNAGTGFPGASSYTGTRLVSPQDARGWSGSVRVGLFGLDGQPIASPYNDEPNGVPPLTLDLASLNNGLPTTQDIIDAINQYYGVPKNKVELGNLNNIQLVSATPALPASPPTFNFGFDLSSLSPSSANFYVTGAEITDNTGALVNNATLNVPTIELASTNTFVTTASSSSVVVNTASTVSLQDGDVIYISSPTSPLTIGGIDSSRFGGYYKISNVTTSSFQIELPVEATLNASTNVAGQVARPPYASVPPGQIINTNSLGVITADLTNNTSSPYYNITISMAVDDGSGVPHTSQVTYRVNNQQSGILGLRVAGLAATGDGEIVTPTINRPLATATLVDAQGRELPKISGKYVGGDSGYLKISAYNSSNTIVIDSLDSMELGRPNNAPAVPGTNRGFSHYFDLNDFLVSNAPTSTGDARAKSAVNMQVSQRLRDNPGLLALGKMTARPQLTAQGLPYNYTYELTPGDNTVIQQMAGLPLKQITFEQIGGLGASTQTFSAYAAQIIGAAATSAANSKANSTNAQTLLEGYAKNASSFSGVNLDTELANTVIYQNAYAASARIITVTNSLFDTLLNTFGR